MGYAQVVDISKYISKKFPKPVRINSEASLGQMLGKGLTDATMSLLSQKFANPRGEKEVRERIIFLLLSNTGLRATELVNLKFSSICASPEGDILVKYSKKGGSVGFAFLSNDLLKEIKDYHNSIGSDADYFILSLPQKNQKFRSKISSRSLQKIINSWNVRTASGKLVHPHAFRHTVAQKTFDNFGSIATQKILGHSSANTTSNYYTRPYFNATSILCWG